LSADQQAGIAAIARFLLTEPGGKCGVGQSVTTRPATGVVASPGSSFSAAGRGATNALNEGFSDKEMPRMLYVPWFRRKDYKHIRSIMDDADQFPETFDEWEKTAKRRLASAAAAGVSIQPVMLDRGEFLAYCKAKNLSARGDHEPNIGGPLH
jgi:hypothetical protein